MRILMCCLLVVACGGKPGPEKATPAPAAPAAPPMRAFDRTLHAIEVNGTRLTYRIMGDTGAPVVFVHGTLKDLREWSGQDNVFAQTHRVLVYSRRYHPPNPQVDDAQPYSLKLHVEDLAALLLTLDIAPAHVVGSSYGAYTALELARKHPELVRSLVLADAPIFPLLSHGEAADSLGGVFYNNALDPARRAFAAGDSVAGIRAFYDGVSGGRGRFDNLPAAGRADLLAHAFEMRREMLANRRDYWPPISCAELGRVTTPVLLVTGDRSPAVFQHITDELARCLQNDTTVIIPRAGHPPHAGNPSYYNQVVLRFIMTH
jgi:pimeloyl-ACP methyl ester carboxylesterase